MTGKERRMCLLEWGTASPGPWSTKEMAGEVRQAEAPATKPTGFRARGLSPGLTNCVDMLNGKSDAPQGCWADRKFVSTKLLRIANRKYS